MPDVWIKKGFSQTSIPCSRQNGNSAPVRRNPEHSSPLLGFRRHPVYVQYYKKDIYVIYNEDKAVLKDVMTFAKAVMEEYLSYRHPYMKTYGSMNVFLKPHQDILSQQSILRLQRLPISLRRLFLGHSST